MEIRELHESDLESLLKLYIQLDEKNENLSLIKSKEIWKQINLNKNIIYIGAIEKETIISTCYLVIIQNLSVGGRSIGFIENVVTHSDYRKKGIGRKVINKAIDLCKKNNCYKVILQSGIKREDAHKFYRKIGFNDKTKKAFDLRLD